MRTIDGIEVINATADFRLPIGPGHILSGDPWNVDGCAGVLACKEHYPNCVRAKFYKSRVFILQKVGNTEEVVWIRYVTPKKMLVLEAINDVVVKDMEQAKKYACEVILKAPTESQKARGAQQGSEKDADLPRPKRIQTIIPMRENAPTGDT